MKSVQRDVIYKAWAKAITGVFQQEGNTRDVRESVLDQDSETLGLLTHL